MRYEYIKIMFLVLIIALLNSCNKTEEKEEACCTDEKASSEISSTDLPDESIYFLESEWENQNSEIVPISYFKGNIVISAMIFTNCPSACPRIVSDLVRIQDGLKEDKKENVKFLLISMDPENDTPEKMRVFMKDYQLDKNWMIIRSDKGSTMEISNVLNVRIKPLKEGGFDHSNIIHIINEEGEIIKQITGLNTDPMQVLNIINEKI